ncbi:hypothetical protein T484DRAFT_1817773 [Baffinella frigidus]|nr:hypothetical protein T484DRAFT_1817773 [Cryptophyta sp. CCMP2293]
MNPGGEGSSLAPALGIGTGEALAAAAAVASVCPADALGGWAELGHVPAHRALAGPSEGARRPAHAERGASRGGMAFASSMEWMGERVGKKVEELQDALKNKRLELCPWEEFGIECEKAATYAQLWINPCQGWNQIQWSVDYFARKCHGTAFVANIWPQTMAGLAHDALSNYEKSKMKAPPFGSYQMETWQHAENAVAAVDRSKDVTWVNDELVQDADWKQDPDWEQVSGEDGISVWRKYLSPNLMIADRKVDRASKFAVVKARAIIDAPVSQVYDLFTDNSRVHEYNEYCKEVTDLAWLDPATKEPGTRN